MHIGLLYKLHVIIVMVIEPLAFPLKLLLNVHLWDSYFYVKVFMFSISLIRLFDFTSKDCAFFDLQIILQQKGSDCKSPKDMAEIVISYLEKSGHLQA